ncbi:PqqD family protein [Sphingomonas sp. ASV193]|uniref:PqqD family protein n=1 Tax=Sphingomonas sp. ASV193 TaxID=3144405 RepID=UPI0032E89071
MQRSPPSHKGAQDQWSKHMTAYRRSASLMEADIGDELVALDEQRGLCFGFSSSATAIWRALAEPSTLDQLVDRMVEDYDVDRASCRADVAACIETMIADGLVAPA